jgi:hypothetical protein
MVRKNFCDLVTKVTDSLLEALAATCPILPISNVMLELIRLT